MNISNRLRTALAAAGVLCAAALATGADTASAQMRLHGSSGAFHGGFHSGGFHGRTTGHVGAWRGRTAWHGWRGGTAWNHRGWGVRGGYWRGGHWYPGWRGGVAVGFYGGYPYYGYPYGYYGYPYGYDYYGGYDDSAYGNAYDSCNSAYGDYDEDDCY